MVGWLVEVGFGLISAALDEEMRSVCGGRGRGRSLFLAGV